jgi:hypothetical protein
MDTPVSLPLEAPILSLTWIPQIAGRGLDIKKYSKGLDSGCVVSQTTDPANDADGCVQYGKQLTALVLGDVKSTRDIKGAKSVRVGSKKGVLIDIECDKATSGKPE